MEKRDTFIFYRSFYEALKRCPDDVRLRLYDTICEYALNVGTEVHLDGIAEIVWLLVEPQLTANNKRFINGKKGGAPSESMKGNQNARKTNREETDNKPKTNQNQTKNKPNNNNNNNNNNNEECNNINVVDVSTTPHTRTHERFQKPTVEEVDQYIREKGYTFDAEAFVSYYESNGWRVGRNPMKDWKAACRTWQGKEPKGKKTKEEEEYDNYYGDGAYKRAKELQQVLDNLAAGNS